MKEPFESRKSELLPLTAYLHNKAIAERENAFAPLRTIAKKITIALSTQTLNPDPTNKDKDQKQITPRPFQC